MADGVRTARLTQSALIADGVFEIALGLLLATSPLTGLEHRMGLPPPGYTGVIVAAGLLLMPLGATLLATWPFTSGNPANPVKLLGPQYIAQDMRC
jgi:hypothetical protein